MSSEELVKRLRSVIGSDISICGEAADMLEEMQKDIDFLNGVWNAQDGWGKVPRLESEVKRLEEECQKLAGWLLHEYVFVHERVSEEVDAVTAPYIGGDKDVVPPFVLVMGEPAPIVLPDNTASVNVRTGND